MENVTTQTVKYLGDSSYDDRPNTPISRSNIIPPSPSAPRRSSSGSGNIRITLSSTRPLVPLFGSSLKVFYFLLFLFLLLFFLNIIINNNF